MKASQLIKTECCGVGLLTTDKAALVAEVELLESQVILLENSLSNAQKEIRRLKGEKRANIINS